MKRIGSRQVQTPARCLSIALAGFLLAGCGTSVGKQLSSVSFKDKVYKNHEGAAYARVRQRGFRFWLRDQVEKDKDGNVVKGRYDELQLKPGTYMLGFVRTTPRVGGAAFCKVNEGRLYSFKITDRQYLRSAGSYAFMGECTFDPDRQQAAK